MLRSSIKELEQSDKPTFLKLMAFGSALVDFAEEGDADGFKDVFVKAKEFGDLLYWHA